MVRRGNAREQHMERVVRNSEGYFHGEGRSSYSFTGHKNSLTQHVPGRILSTLHVLTHFNHYEANTNSIPNLQVRKLRHRSEVTCLGLQSLHQRLIQTHDSKSIVFLPQHEQPGALSSLASRRGNSCF